MMLHKTKLECPRCHWIFEVAPYDSEHLVCSLEKPQKNRILNEIREINHVCRNPKCKESITIYSYTPVDFFSRV
jgi:hypothetical protein